tara:strand:- start:46 stop:984 length:939 start_codon:yes stop_codon:yes gene_type:complete
MSQNIPTIANITDWLINNPTKTNKRGRQIRTGVPDAAKALGYTGPPLKIREGNLTNGRQFLRLSLKGKSSQSDYYRSQAQARTTPDPSVRAQANSKVRRINAQSSTVNTADHILSNSALSNGEEFVRAIRGEEGVQQMRQRYKDAGVGYGHSPKNLQALTSKQNGIKEVQERTLRGNNRNKTAYLQHLETKPPVTSPDYPKWEQDKARFVNKINNPLGLELIERALSTDQPSSSERVPSSQPQQLSKGRALILHALGKRPLRTTTNELGGQNLPESDAQTEDFINDIYEYTPKGAKDLPHPATSTYPPLKGV